MKRYTFEEEKNVAEKYQTIASVIPTFSTGEIIVSRPVEEALFHADWFKALCKHATCNWGSVSRLEWMRNDAAVGRGGRLVSVHETECGLPVVIVTSSNRRSTTLYLKCEY